MPTFGFSLLFYCENKRDSSRNGCQQQRVNPDMLRQFRKYRTDGRGMGKQHQPDCRAEQRGHQHRARRDILRIADHRVMLPRHAVAQRFNRRIDQLRRRHQPEAQAQHSDFCAAQIRQKSGSRDITRCRQMDAEIALAQSEAYAACRPVK